MEITVCITGNKIFNDKSSVVNPFNLLLSYGNEIKFVEQALCEINKNFSDIIDYKYVPGLRQPLHMGRSFNMNAASSVDGYEVVLTIRD